MRVIACLVEQHNLWLIALALVTCVSGSWVTLRLFLRVVGTRYLQRVGWAFLASVAGGATIWCTHFIAMLAYQVNAPVVFDWALTLLSLLIAIAGNGAGYLFIASKAGQRMPWLGGAIVGLATSAMHYTGMMAYRVDGFITWDSSYVIASVLLAVAIAGAAMTVAAQDLSRWKGLLAPGLFALAIVSLHFTAMTAVSVSPATLSDAGLDQDAFVGIALAVGAVGLIIVAVAATSYLLDDTERAKTLAKLQKLAHNDPLTGLPNRRSYQDHLSIAFAEAQSKGQNIAVIGIDLNRFKEINDTFGHAAGDEVLKAVATRLARLQRDGEFIARLGGDEFAATKRFSDRDELVEFTAKLESAILQPVALDGWETSVGASIGVAIFPDDGGDIDTLTSNADLAMYRAKANIAERICFYEPLMDEAARDRRNIANDLRFAIERNQFELHYQVQTSVQDGAVLGYEALLRWRHPERGMVSPMDFIPIAEECGAILSIGEWVLRTACREATQFPSNMRIAVNLSPVQLAHADFSTFVHQVLLETKLAPHRLELEITETAIIADKIRTLHILRRIKALGVTIAIDDFGIGYSSLDTLRSFPFDKIKLDRSFMLEAPRNPQAKAIVRAVLTLGRSLAIPVLAEGIETEDQLSLLRAEGYDEAQGYLLGWPATIEIIHQRMTEPPPVQQRRVEL